MRENITRRIVYMGLLIAIQMVLTRVLSITTPIVRIGFGFLPVVIAGMMFGPVYAGAGAVIGDLLGTVLFPGLFFPGFTLSALVSGVVYGVFFYRKPKRIWRIACVVIIDCLFVSLCMNTYWIYLMTGEGYLALLPPRIMQNALMAPVMFLTILVVAYPIRDRLGSKAENKNMKESF